ncbi:MAG: SDR family oxidoreductase [Bacilli bacterium]
MKKKNFQKPRSALVTGAGSGLGFATAKMLKEEGWIVYGSHIKGQSTAELVKLDITPIELDISDLSSVEIAVKAIEDHQKEDGLSALINVAGVAGIAGGVIEGVSDERIKALFDVNVIGTLNMCRAFLPLLRKYGPGRIVNVSSSGVRTPTAFSGIYAISKYAVEGITNALRYEMPIFGIQVTSIEPGAMKTPMTADGKENMKKTWEMMKPGIKELYYDKLNPSLEFMQEMMSNSSPPEVVAKVILKALNKKKMKIRYVGGNDVKVLPFMQKLLGENLFEKMMLKIQKLI